MLLPPPSPPPPRCSGRASDFSGTEGAQTDQEGRGGNAPDIATVSARVRGRREREERGGDGGKGEGGGRGGGV